MQARWVGHSELLTHSGLQYGGTPIYSDLHEHIGVPETSLQTEFGPQGEGMQASTITGSSS